MLTLKLPEWLIFFTPTLANYVHHLSANVLPETTSHTIINVCYALILVLSTCYLVSMSSYHHAAPPAFIIDYLANLCTFV